MSWLVIQKHKGWLNEMATVLVVALICGLSAIPFVRCYSTCLSLARGSRGYRSSQVTIAQLPFRSGGTGDLLYLVPYITSPQSRRLHKHVNCEGVWGGGGLMKVQTPPSGLLGWLSCTRQDQLSTEKYLKAKPLHITQACLYPASSDPASCLGHSRYRQLSEGSPKGEDAELKVN